MFTIDVLTCQILFLKTYLLLLTSTSSCCVTVQTKVFFLPLYIFSPDNITYTYIYVAAKTNHRAARVTSLPNMNFKQIQKNRQTGRQADRQTGRQADSYLSSPTPLTSFPQWKKDKDRRKVKGRRCCLGDRIYSVPCRAFYFALGRF